MKKITRAILSRMRILEIGRYVAPAYAGMILAEQGHEVVKWVMPEEPILRHRKAKKLWAWINEGKMVEPICGRKIEQARDFDVILTNLRSANSRSIADKTGSAVIKLIATIDGARSFDVVAQAQAWGAIVPWVPFWIGDTVAGLWMAFKALNSQKGDVVEIQHAAALAKLVECELMPINDKRKGDRTPWEQAKNYIKTSDGATVKYNKERIFERNRTAQWRRKHIKHERGRIII